jgi:hypothetical protein
MEAIQQMHVGMANLHRILLNVHSTPGRKAADGIRRKVV